MLNFEKINSSEIKPKYSAWRFSQLSNLNNIKLKDCQIKFQIFTGTNSLAGMTKSLCLSRTTKGTNLHLVVFFRPW